MTDMIARPAEILLVEDNPSDVRLAVEVFKHVKGRNKLTVAKDGFEALAILRREGRYAGAARPDIVLLDLNLPNKDGREVLAEIKADRNLRSIPVIALTTSRTREDVLMAYDLHANCYITKPVDLDQFLAVVKSIENFWLNLARLPQNDENGTWAHQYPVD